MLPLAALASSTALLGAKSSASDVLQALRSSLPPYVSRGGTAVVTGANSGIGKESVRVLLDAGCHVVLCSRDAEAGARAVEEMGPFAVQNCRVQQLDLADLSSVKAASEEIKRREGTISLLLNNAGVMATPRGQTKQGFELQLGTNHLGHHAFTRCVDREVLSFALLRIVVDR